MVITGPSHFGAGGPSGAFSAAGGGGRVPGVGGTLASRHDPKLLADIVDGMLEIVGEDGARAGLHNPAPWQVVGHLVARLLKTEEVVARQRGVPSFHDLAPLGLLASLSAGIERPDVKEALGGLLPQGVLLAGASGEAGASAGAGAGDDVGARAGPGVVRAVSLDDVLGVVVNALQRAPREWLKDEGSQLLKARHEELQRVVRGHTLLEVPAEVVRASVQKLVTAPGGISAALSSDRHSGAAASTVVSLASLGIGVEVPSTQGQAGVCCVLRGGCGVEGGDVDAGSSWCVLRAGGGVVR